MKMGNITPRTVIEPTSLAFRARVLTITLPRLPDVTTLPTPNYLCGSLPEKSVRTITYKSMARTGSPNSFTWTRVHADARETSELLNRKWPVSVQRGNFLLIHPSSF